MTPTASGFTLRQLPLPPKLVLAVFLASVGLGYTSALVQLHFQKARPGHALPDSSDLQRIYAGDAGPPISRVEQLLEAAEGPFNGAGTMRPAFTEKSVGWEELVRGKTAEELRSLLAQREGERQALLSWVRAGAPRESYLRDEWPLGEDLASQPLTPEFVKPATQPGSPSLLRIRSLVRQRCVCCHGPEPRDEYGAAQGFPLESYEQLLPYCQSQPSRGLSLPRLAQTTHVHLLGFAMLYGLTGLIFTCTSYSARTRIFFGLLPLVVQVVDIACWWLARLEPLFAQAIFYTGLAAGVGLAVQIGGSLWDMFDRGGRTILLILLVTGVGLGGVLKWYVLDPYLAQEKRTSRPLSGSGT